MDRHHILLLCLLLCLGISCSFVFEKQFHNRKDVQTLLVLQQFISFPSKEMHRSAKLLHTNRHTIAVLFFFLLTLRDDRFIPFAVFTLYLEHLKLCCIQQQNRKYQRFFLPRLTTNYVLYLVN